MKNLTGAWMKMMSNTPAHNRVSPLSSYSYSKGIKVMELRRASVKALAEINVLLPQLSKTAKPLSLTALANIIKDKNNYLVVAKDGAQIVGMGTLIAMHTVVGVHTRIENVVVDEKYRGKGIGEKISKKLIALAKSKKVGWIELSSRPSRVAANKLYKKLGFRQKKTNVYSLIF